ncbi:hypothetical protein ScPMuIL_017181 [Solemya velum]
MRKGRVSKPVGGKGENGGSSMPEPCSCNNGHEVAFVCRRCKIPICSKCRTAKHKHHESGRIREVAEELKTDIQKTASERCCKDKMDSILKRKKAIQAFKDESLRTESHEIDRIDEHFNTLYKHLDEIRKELVTAVSSAIRKDTEYLEREERSLDKIANSITKMCEDAEKLTAQSDMEIVKTGYAFFEDMKDAMETDVGPPAVDQAFSVSFEPGSVDQTLLMRMFGEVFEGEAIGGGVYTVQQKMTFNIASVPGLIRMFNVSGLGRISDLCHGVTNDDCWVGSGRSNQVKLVGVSGDERRVINLGVGGCRGMTRTDDGYMYMSCGDKCIYEVQPNLKVSKWRVMPFSPCCLTSDPRTNDLLVCDGGHRGGIFTITNSGVEKILPDVPFECAIDIAVNSVGDMCVCDSDQHRVLLFNSNQHHIGTYDTCSQNLGLRDKFRPISVVCDNETNFVIVDEANFMLHFIDRVGVLLFKFSTRQDCPTRPLSVSLSKAGLLWVGFDGGNVCVFNLLPVMPQEYGYAGFLP